MADRSFEEQVREELAGFKLRPDEEVWHNIALALRRKKRRWALWLFLLAGCAAGSFLTYHQFSKEQQSGATGKIQAKQNNQPVIPQTNQQKENNLPEKTILPGKEITNDAEKKVDATEKLIITRPQKEKIDALEMSGDKNNVSQANNSRQIVKSPVPEKKIAENISESGKTNADSKEILNQTITKTTDEATDQKLAYNEPVKTDSSVITPANGQALPSTAKNKNQKKYPWQFALSTEMGSSGTGNLSSFGSNIPLYLSFSPSNAVFAQSTSNSLSFRSNAFSFGFGMEASKRISKRLGFNLSAGYELYQSRVGVGKRVDSTFIVNSSGQTNNGGFFYTNSDNSLYTNQYHFLGAAFSFYADYKIMRSVFLRWQLGIGANVLISSKVLQYNAAYSILFQNRASLNKMQLDVSTGFDIGIGKEPAVYIGPHINYFLTPASQQQGNTDQHLIRTAIKATFIITRKKK